MGQILASRDPWPASYVAATAGSGAAAGISAASIRSASRLVSAAVCSRTSRSARSAQLARYGLRLVLQSSPTV